MAETDLTAGGTAGRDDAPPPSSGGVTDIAAAVTPKAEVPKSLMDLQERRVAQEREDEQKFLGQSGQDQARARQYLEAEGVNPDDVPPWSVDAERRKYETDPIQSFGSIGSVFAVLASTFTRQPMVNALNGSAAAMEAIKTGNDKEYQRAYDAWKANTSLALKRAELMREKYRDALDLYKTNMTVGEAMFKAHALRFGDEKMLGMMREGMWPEIFQMQEARANAETATAKALEASLAAATDKMSVQTYVKQALQGMPEENLQRFNQEWSRGNVQGAIAAIPPEYQQKFTDVLRQWRQEKLWRGSTGPEAVAVSKFLQENPHATAEQIQDFIQRGKPGRSAPATALRKFLSENPEASSEDIKKFMADFYGEAAKARVTSAGEARAVTGALTQIVRTQAAISAYEDTALANFKVLVQLGDKVDKTGIPVIERWIRAGRREIAGDVDVNNFHAQLSLVKPEIAKIMTNPNLSGVLTDSARNEVGEFLSKDMTSKMLHGLAPLLEGDFKRRTDALERQREKLTKELHGEKSDEPAKPSGGDEGWTTLPNGVRIREKK